MGLDSGDGDVSSALERDIAQVRETDDARNFVERRQTPYQHRGMVGEGLPQHRVHLSPYCAHRCEISR